MGRTVELNYACRPIPSASGEPNFLIAIESGSNNVTQRRIGENGRPYERMARDWGIYFAGSYEQVLEQTCLTASCCYGGMVEVRGKGTTGGLYIARIRRLMDDAKKGKYTPFAFGFEALADPTDPIVKTWQDQGLSTRETTRWSTKYITLDNDMETLLPHVFGWIDLYGYGHYGRFKEYGLPDS